MKNILLCHVTSDGQVLSPAVGCFFRCSRAVTQGYALGTLERLQKRYTLVVPQEFAGATPTLPSGTFVDVGDVIAHRAQADSSPNLQKMPEQTLHVIRAPASGFLIWHDDTGKPYQKPGDKLTRGDIIAVLEFMKIRMEIAFDGNEPAVFEAYSVSHQTSVETGQIIATYREI